MVAVLCQQDLVAAWQDPTGKKEDESFLDLDVRETPAIDENE